MAFAVTPRTRHPGRRPRRRQSYKGSVSSAEFEHRSVSAQPHHEGYENEEQPSLIRAHHVVVRTVQQDQGPQLNRQYQDSLRRRLPRRSLPWRCSISSPGSSSGPAVSRFASQRRVGQERSGQGRMVIGGRAPNVAGTFAATKEKATTIRRPTILLATKRLHLFVLILVISTLLILPCLVGLAYLRRPAVRRGAGHSGSAVWAAFAEAQVLLHFSTSSDPSSDPLRGPKGRPNPLCAPPVDSTGLLNTSAHPKTSSLPTCRRAAGPDWAAAHGAGRLIEGRREDASARSGRRGKTGRNCGRGQRLRVVPVGGGGRRGR